MKPTLLFLAFIFNSAILSSQLSPAIEAWLQNTTSTGTYYMSGNSTAIDNGLLYNCQTVEYSDDFVYINTHGIPSYPTGPFLDGNPSIASDQNAIYKFPLVPTANTGTLDATTPGNIGVFINGVSLFDYRDGVGWNPNTNTICGGPGNPPCPGGPMGGSDWNRDAIPAERAGFDCSKAHPAMGNYHHHQNPSAFKLDLNVISDICNLYDAEGLYTIDSAQHSPLIGFAYDGFPIYGAYGFANVDGSGGITRIKSGYQLRNITQRTTWADGTIVDNGPDVSTTYWLGYFREDYEFVDQTVQEDYLDQHNGRFCVTPEYPNGTYAYFATVDESWNSAYPYVVGPTFYGNYENRKVTSINEPTTVYLPVVLAEKELLFEAQRLKDHNVILWKLNDQKDIQSYQLERSKSSTDFQMLTIVEKDLFIEPSSMYTYEDHIPMVSDCYYRLKMIYNDGTVELSEIIHLGMESLEIDDFNIFPNPATDFLAIQYNGLIKFDFQLYLYSLDGKLIDSGIIEAGSTQGYFDVRRLYSGQYLLSISSGENSIIETIQIK